MSKRTSWAKTLNGWPGRRSVFTVMLCSTLMGQAFGQQRPAAQPPSLKPSSIKKTPARDTPQQETPAPDVAPSGKSSPSEPSPDKATDFLRTPGGIMAEADGRYRIGPGDVLTIQVFNRPQLSREAVRVDGRGMIRMPWIDDEIRVACRTEAEVAEELTTRYLHLLRAPQIGVFIKEFQSQPVAVIGAVNQPGRFQLQRRVRLLELLTFAGGPAERAGRTVQVIHTAPAPFCEQRDNVASTAGSENNAETLTTANTNAATPTVAEDTAAQNTDEDFASLSLSEVMHGNVQANPFIRPGDIVTLPDAQQIFVVGNVLKPSTLTLREPLTVSQAIAMAGGLLPDSKSSRVRIVRQTPGGKSEIYVDLKAIDTRRAEDVALQANDIVNVPTAGGKRFLRTVLSAVVPAVGQLPVRIIP